ncbi:MAG: LysR family transcriptional regulator [Rhizorhabdus sp.]
MDMKRLGYFAQVAELGSLLRTSERLGITQPSLSRQVRLLEEELGVTLFRRGARGMALTEAGEVLYRRIAGPLREIGHALYEVRALPTETGGNVVLGMPPTMVQLLAGTVARRVARSAPNISLRIVDSYSGHLLKWMNAGELDAAILYGPTPAGMNAAKLVEDELLLVGPAKSPLAHEGVIDFKRLADLPLILPSPSHGLRILVETAAERARTKLSVHTQADSYHLMKELVESGLGYTLLPHCAFVHEVALGRLTFARVRTPAITRQLYLALRSDAESPRPVLQVESFVREEVATMIRDGRWPGGRLRGIGDP